MKPIRKTTAKTRKGVIKWLQKFNPFLPSEELYDNENIVAVHVNRYTGAIVSYETAKGALLPATLFYPVALAA